GGPRRQTRDRQSLGCSDETFAAAHVAEDLSSRSEREPFEAFDGDATGFAHQRVDDADAVVDGEGSVPDARAHDRRARDRPRRTFGAVINVEPAEPGARADLIEDVDAG